MSKIQCSIPECQDDFEDGVGTCLMSEPDCKTCKNYQGKESNEEKTITELTEDSNEYQLPWYGAAMGKSDINLINIKSPPFIIGVVGEANAGKTSLLAALYMLLRSGRNIGNFTFAGSYSLLGWEAIARTFDFTKKLVTFPPHTGSNAQRIPGLLHLLLKDKNGQFRDVLFTDAPGEWFAEWSVSSESEAAKGAKWIDDSADAFLIVADSKAFKENVGKSRGKLMGLVNRMVNTNKGRPTALVWTKSDKDFDEKRKTRLSDMVKEKLPQLKKYDTALVDHNSQKYFDNILNFTNHLLTNSKKNTVPFIKPKNTEDFFFVMR